MKQGLHINAQGTKEWYKNDKLHREDGPAIIYSFCRQEWYQFGQLHRTDGPAIINKSGSQYWYINGQIIAHTQKDFNDYLIQQNLKTIL